MVLNDAPQGLRLTSYLLFPQPQYLWVASSVSRTVQQRGHPRGLLDIDERKLGKGYIPGIKMALLLMMMMVMMTVESDSQHWTYSPEPS